MKLKSAASVQSENPSPVVIAVVVTNRSDSFARLLDSLQPVSGDSALHLVVMDNCTDPDQSARLRAHVDGWHHRAAGSAFYDLSPHLGSPLHEARLALTRTTLAFVRRLSTPPAIWVIDDDLTFERLVRSGSALRLENVAAQHLEVVRLWHREGRADVVLGDFTGDPPIRPEAILATQLRDLALNLGAMARMSPEAVWETPDFGGTWRGDYFYDHAERGGEHLNHGYGWLRREGAPPDTRAQFLAMCQAAVLIGEGRTPFRPQLSQGEPQMGARTMAPRRGGNTVFFDLYAFAAHAYPSIPVGRGWSRRSDMIGATLLARRAGVVFFESTLTLHHDRTGQPSISRDLERWLPEFLGVMLARLVMNPEHVEEPMAFAQAQAQARCARILETMTLARRRASEARAALRRGGAWWWGPETLEAAGALDAHLQSILETLEAVSEDELRQRLLNPSLAEAASAAYDALCPSFLEAMCRRRA